MKAKRTLDLTEGSITGKLLSFAMPIFLSLVLQHLYAMADRIVVGNYAHNGTVALAAVGSTGAATTLVLNLFTKKAETESEVSVVTTKPKPCWMQALQGTVLHRSFMTAKR